MDVCMILCAQHSTSHDTTVVVVVSKLGCDMIYRHHFYILNIDYASDQVSDDDDFLPVRKRKPPKNAPKKTAKPAHKKTK